MGNTDIFITTDNQVKVLDFGVACMREANSGVEATRAGTAIGTPSYMAPEQALVLRSSSRSSPRVAGTETPKN